MQVLAADLDGGLLRQRLHLVKGNDLLQLDGREGALARELAAVEIKPAGKVKHGKVSWFEIVRRLAFCFRESNGVGGGYIGAASCLA